MDDLERRLKVLEDIKTEEDELVRAAFEPPKRKGYPRDEVEQYGKLRKQP